MCTPFHRRSASTERSVVVVRVSEPESVELSWLQASLSSRHPLDSLFLREHFVTVAYEAIGWVLRFISRFRFGVSIRFAFLYLVTRKQASTSMAGLDTAFKWSKVFFFRSAHKHPPTYARSHEAMGLNVRCRQSYEIKRKNRTKNWSASLNMIVTCQWG